MIIGSLTFLLCLLVLASFFFLIPSLRLRQLLLASCNLGFLATYTLDPVAWLVFGVFLASGYGMARAAGAIAPSRLRSAAIAAYLIALVLVFCLLKRYDFLLAILPPLPPAWSVAGLVGLSYMLFRQIHFVVDSAQGQIVRPTPWEYLNYQLNFLTLTAGPIQRFEDFRASWSRLAPAHRETADILATYTRLLWGAIKIGLLGDALLRETTSVAGMALSIHRPLDVIAFLELFYGYPLYIYLNFSGYCDMVIAGGALLGIALPENFNRPYVSRNMIDYWTRWHISLSQWIRDYVFIPVCKGGIERWPAQAQAISYLSYLLAFLITGIWHGSTWNFAVFGLANAVGVITAKAWEGFIIRRFGRPGLRRYLGNRWIAAAAVFITLNYVAFTILFFPADLHARLGFLRHFLLDR